MCKQEIILIAAMAENRVIGKDNSMPWSIKGNLALFKETTMGWPCIMGRKTWDSLPKRPLPGRLNIVISKTMKEDTLILTQRHEGHNSLSLPSASSAEPSVRSLREIKLFPSLSLAIEYCSNYEKIFICGGESIYTQVMPLATKIELTLIPGEYEGDTFFPEIDDSLWTITNTVNYDNFSIITYTKEQL